MILYAPENKKSLNYFMPDDGNSKTHNLILIHTQRVARIVKLCFTFRISYL